MPYHFSRHAQNRMRWRQIQLSPEQVIGIIENPDVETPTIEGRTNAWQRRNGDWIRVTWINENNATTVISVNRDDHGPPI